MTKKTSGDSASTWAYAYEIAPPQAVDRLRPIVTLLDRENEVARREGRIWTGKLVLEHQVTHILVVSDNPAQDIESNLRLEAGLEELQARYSLTLPMAVAADAGQDPPTGAETGRD